MQDRKAFATGTGGHGGRRGIAETGVVSGRSAALAGTLAAIVTTCSEVVKTRMTLAAGGGVDGDNTVGPWQGQAGVNDRRSTLVRRSPDRSATSEAFAASFSAAGCVVRGQLLAMVCTWACKRRPRCG